LLEHGLGKAENGHFEVWFGWLVVDSESSKIRFNFFSKSGFFVSILN
jgi:hypothetical protein